MKDIVQDLIEDLQIKVDKKFKLVDDRFDTLKKEFNLDDINKLLKNKANKVEVNSKLGSHESKLKIVNQNIECIAKDFETFQSAINKMYGVMIELQEANKDVLLGKRKFDCLSCGPVDYKQIVQGTDGKVYRADQGLGV